MRLKGFSFLFLLGAPCPVKLCEDVVNELNAKDFTIGYGMTETSPITFQGFPNDSVELKTSTIGFPADHTEVSMTTHFGAHCHLAVLTGSYYKY